LTTLFTVNNVGRHYINTPDALYNEAAKTESILDAKATNKKKMIPKDLEGEREPAPKEVMLYHNGLTLP
jgi:hypothetical protein